YGHQHVHSPGLSRKLMPTKTVEAYEDQDLVLYNDQKEPLLVPTGRVIATVSIKVPTGRYIVPAGYIISPGRVT
ncbi:hypothetical protein Tco_1072030, partial [Tanacetum coccineum]